MFSDVFNMDLTKVLNRMLFEHCQQLEAAQEKTGLNQSASKKVEEIIAVSQPTSGKSLENRVFQSDQPASQKAKEIGSALLSTSSKATESRAKGGIVQNADFSAPSKTSEKHPLARMDRYQEGNQKKQKIVFSDTPLQTSSSRDPWSFLNDDLNLPSEMVDSLSEISDDSMSEYQNMMPRISPVTSEDSYCSDGEDGLAPNFNSTNKVRDNFVDRNEHKKASSELNAAAQPIPTTSNRCRIVLKPYSLSSEESTALENIKNSAVKDLMKYKLSHPLVTNTFLCSYFEVNHKTLGRYRTKFLNTFPHLRIYLCDK